MFIVCPDTLHFKDIQFAPLGVSCPTWAVILPKTILVINDSCVTIPCRFTIPSNQEANILNCSKGVVWKKGSTIGPEVFIAHTPQLNLIQVGPLFVPASIICNLLVCVCVDRICQSHGVVSIQDAITELHRCVVEIIMKVGIQDKRGPSPHSTPQAQIGVTAVVIQSNNTYLVFWYLWKLLTITKM